MNSSITIHNQRRNIADQAGVVTRPGYLLTKRQVSGINKLLFQLLVLISIGPIYNDVLLYRMGGFPITLEHLFLAVMVIIILLKRRHLSIRFFIPVLWMILLELAHALMFGFATDTRWIQSFAQFSVYAASFVLMTSLKLDHDDLQEMTPWILKCGIFFGGIGIAQFLLMNIAGVHAYLPADWRVKGYIPFGETRTGGFAPAIGLAMEPSYYAIGLVTLLVCIFSLDNNGCVENRTLWRSAMLFALGGILVSFSLTGILGAVALLLVQFFSLRSIMKRPLNIVAIILIAMIAVESGITGPIQQRLQKVLRGADNSALVRTVAAIQLLLAPPNDVELFVLGTGLGMEQRNSVQYSRIYREVSLRDLDFSEVKIHNIFTVIKFFQGWVGLLLYSILLWRILLPLAGKWKTCKVLGAFFILYHFSWGMYLSPATWATFALVAILRRSQPLSGGEKSVMCSVDRHVSYDV